MAWKILRAIRKGIKKKAQNMKGDGQVKNQPAYLTITMNEKSEEEIEFNFKSNIREMTLENLENILTQALKVVQDNMKKEDSNE